MDELQKDVYDPVEQTAQHKRNMLAALRQSLGIISQACVKAEVGRTTHYDWMKTDPEYAAEVKQIDEEMLDLGESALFTKVKDGDMTAIIFFLKTKGRARGYIEKRIYEIEGLEQIEQNRQLLAKLAGLVIPESTTEGNNDAGDSQATS